MSISPISPMLASSSGAGFDTLVGGGAAGWFYDLKMDGLRCMAYTDDGEVRLLNRSLVDITALFPDVVAQLTGYGPLPAKLILDGEIVTLDGQFESVARRGKQNARSAPALAAELPAKFWAFDVLHTGTEPPNGIGTFEVPFGQRREFLESIEQNTGLAVVMGSDDPGLYALTRTMGLEGVVAKQNASFYMPGRRSLAWVKFKNVHRLTVLGTGYLPGTAGSPREHFGSMTMHLIKPDLELQFIGRVGGGFKAADIAAVKAELDRGVHVIAEIECLNRTGSGVLRMPQFKGLRTDVPLSACTVDQLDTIPTTGKAKEVI